jgi:hypothetical protein
MVVLSNSNKSTGQWFINQFILFSGRRNIVTGCNGESFPSLSRYLATDCRRAAFGGLIHFATPARLVIQAGITQINTDITPISSQN